MSYQIVSRPARDAFERKLARMQSTHERIEAQRSIRFAMLCEDAQALVAWGVREGLIQHPNDNNNGGKHDK